MLSRVAERVYWTARYLERVENTARLLSVFNSLLLDLPRGVDLNWYNLVIITGSEEDFNKRYEVRSERNVVKYIISDAKNSSSVINTMRWIKENVRTSRDVVPIETWELINELYIFVRQNLQSGINKSTRHEFLDQLVVSCQQIVGLMGGIMIRDAGWYFLRLGRNIERADMVTRFLDVGAAVIMNDDDSPNREQIVWGNVLSSASAGQAYLKTTGSLVNGPEVAEFLIENPLFPRSVRFCLVGVKECIDRLPRNRKLTLSVKEVLAHSTRAFDYTQLGQEFRDHLNEIQMRISGLHNEVSENWFAVQ